MNAVSSELQLNFVDAFTNEKIDQNINISVVMGFIKK